MHMLKRRASRIAGLLGLLTMSLCPVHAFAQGAGATLQGTLTDEQGGMLPGVTVTVTNVESGFKRSVVSDQRGWYRAAALNPGPYEVRAELSGFLPNVRSGLTLTIGQEATVNLQGPRCKWLRTPVVIRTMGLNKKSAPQRRK